MSVKPKRLFLSSLLSLSLLGGSHVSAISPQDSNGIYYSSSYNYNSSLKTFNTEVSGPRTLVNMTFGNTVGLGTNSIAGSYLYIENNHNSNTYAYYYTIGYKNSYVSLDDIYYRSDSDTKANMTVNHAYQSDGTIDTTIIFGNSQLGMGWLTPDKRIRVYLDWKYKASPANWYYWTPEYYFINKNYHFISGLSTPTTDLFNGLSPEVGSTGNVQLLGSSVSTNKNTFTENNAANLEEQQEAFKEWEEIQLKKKQGTWKAENYTVTVSNEEGEIVYTTDSETYKKNKVLLEEALDLVPN